VYLPTRLPPVVDRPLHLSPNVPVPGIVGGI
jgi:hypothetical protein